MTGRGTRPPASGRGPTPVRTAYASLIISPKTSPIEGCSTGSGYEEGAVAFPSARPLQRCYVSTEVRSVALTLRGNLPLQQGTNLRLPVTAVAAQRADCTELA